MYTAIIEFASFAHGSPAYREAALARLAEAMGDIHQLWMRESPGNYDAVDFLTICPDHVVIDFASFNDESSVGYREAALTRLCEAMIDINMHWLAENPKVPDFYSVFPKYVLKVRPLDFDHWQDALRTIELLSGDCKDFVCFRVAQLRLLGHDVYPLIKSSQMEDMTVYHVVLYRPSDNEEEDPSAILGMPKQVTYEQLRYGGEIK
jgi:hypothetical protein